MPRPFPGRSNRARVSVRAKPLDERSRLLVGKIAAVSLTSVAKVHAPLKAPEVVGHRRPFPAPVGEVIGDEDTGGPSVVDQIFLVRLTSRKAVV